MMQFFFLLSTLGHGCIYSSLCLLYHKVLIFTGSPLPTFTLLLVLAEGKEGGNEVRRREGERTEKEERKERKVSEGGKEGKKHAKTSGIHIFPHCFSSVSLLFLLLLLLLFLVSFSSSPFPSPSSFSVSITEKHLKELSLYIQVSILFYFLNLIPIIYLSCCMHVTVISTLPNSMVNTHSTWYIRNISNSQTALILENSPSSHIRQYIRNKNCTKLLISYKMEILSANILQKIAICFLWCICMQVNNFFLIWTIFHLLFQNVPFSLSKVM